MFLYFIDKESLKSEMHEMFKKKDFIVAIDFVANKMGYPNDSVEYSKVTAEDLEHGEDRTLVIFSHNHVYHNEYVTTIGGHTAQEMCAHLLSHGLSSKHFNEVLLFGCNTAENDDSNDTTMTFGDMLRLHFSQNEQLKDINLYGSRGKIRIDYNEGDRDVLNIMVEKGAQRYEIDQGGFILIEEP